MAGGDLDRVVIEQDLHGGGVVEIDPVRALLGSVVFAEPQGLEPDEIPGKRITVGRRSARRSGNARGRLPRMRGIASSACPRLNGQ